MGEKKKFGGAKQILGGQSNVFRHEMHGILLKITFNLNYLGAKQNFRGHLPRLLPPGYVPDLEGSLGGWYPVLPLICAHVREHTVSETAHTHKFTAHRHIVEQTHCCTWVVPQVLQILVISRKVCTHSKTSAHRLQKIRGNIGGTFKVSSNIGLLCICGYKKKPAHWLKPFKN